MWMFFGMKNFPFNWLITGIVMAGMPVYALTKLDAFRCMPASHAHRKSCSIFAEHDQRPGWRRQGMKQTSSPTRRRKTGAFMSWENGDVADNQTVATLKSWQRRSP